MSSSEHECFELFPVDRINLLECTVTYKFAVICIMTYEAELVKYCLLAGLPSPPRTPSSTVQQYGRDSVTLTVQWEHSLDDGGDPVSYTITVSPGVGTFITSGRNVSVAVPYNVRHTVSIVATNCIGNSNVTMETIPIVGMLSCVGLYLYPYFHPSCFCL